ncbi:MAG TPA: hypothetical protein VJR58_22185 [Vineibacter sp.]|nr:hypothetical protein [Vineibacter sp.]
MNGTRVCVADVNDSAPLKERAATSPVHGASTAHVSRWAEEGTMPLAPLILAYLAPFMWLTIVGAAYGLPLEASHPAIGERARE